MHASNGIQFVSRYLLGTGRKIAELAAGTQYVASATLSDEYVDAGLSHDRLKGQHVAFGWTTKGTARKLIEGNQIDFAGDAADEFEQAPRVFFTIVYVGQEHVLKGESSGRELTDSGGRRRGAS